MGSDEGNTQRPSGKPQQPQRPLSQPAQATQPRFTLRMLSPSRWFMSHWKDFDIGHQDQVRWAMRMSTIYMSVILGASGLFYLSMPFIDEWRRKKILSGEMQQYIAEKEELDRQTYSPKLLDKMEDFSEKINSHAIYTEGGLMRDDRRTRPPKRPLRDVIEEERQKMS